MDTRRRSGAVTHACFDVSFIGSSPSPARRPSRSLSALPLGPCRVALAWPPHSSPAGRRQPGHPAFGTAAIQKYLYKYASDWKSRSTHPCSCPSPNLNLTISVVYLFFIYYVRILIQSINFLSFYVTCLGFQSSDL